MMFWQPDMTAWGYVAMIVGMVVFWGLLVLAVAGSVRLLGRLDRPVVVSPTAELVLAERFAHGDIDEREYRHRLDVLGGASPSDV